MNHHPHDRPWLADKFRALPEDFERPMLADYGRVYDRDGRQAANCRLREFVGTLNTQAVTLAGDDWEVVNLAELRAARCQRHKGSTASLLAWVESLGLTPPEVGKGGVTLSGARARLCEPLWWRRQLRKKQGREVEGVARAIGMVQKRAGIYASDKAVKRRTQQKARAREMLATINAVNELGDSYTLEELADLSTSNPTLRRHELMARAAGFEAVADQRGDVGEFVTLTCPSRFHAYHHTGRKNHKHDDSTPRDAQDHLTKCWARTRAWLHRRNVSVYGFRVAEPHHDGTPHWHMLLFVDPAHVGLLRQALKHYFLNQHNPEEFGAEKNRVKFVSIDRARGSAAGYIAKYVAKNIDGAHMDKDELSGRDAPIIANRVESWAATWGIRQFQQIGGAAVTVWRELRRLDSSDHEVIEQARQAADAGDWAAFIDAMGGPTIGRDAPIKITYHQDKQNQYGEQVKGAVLGVGVGLHWELTRVHTWEIKPTASEPEMLKAAREIVERIDAAQHPYVLTLEQMRPVAINNDYHVSLFRRKEYLEKGRTAPAWSSVNNCTHLEDYQPGEYFAFGRTKPPPTPTEEGKKHVTPSP